MSSPRVVIVWSLLVAAAASGAACYSPSSVASPSSPSAPSAPTPVTGGSTSTVEIPNNAAGLGNKAFPPNPLTVDAGTTVTWVNTDSVAHTSTSNVSGWDSGIIAPGAQYAVAFNTSGTFEYHCAIHPGMVGTVVVR